MSKEDAIFIAGNFENYEFPREKKYLLKYFTTNIQISFLRYIFLFGNYRNFVDHTGIYCQERYMKIMWNALHKLQEAHAKAKKELDFDFLVKIENGKFSITSLPKV